MAAKAVILHAAILAAAAFAAAPSLAQTNDTSLTQKQVDCLNRKTAADADCSTEGDDKVGKSGAGPVFLPALIVDLFPNPPAGATPPAPPQSAA